MRIIDTLLNQTPASKGHHSARHSVKSNASYLEMKEAVLRAAVVKKKFVIQEAKIIRQRAELEIKLKAIKIEEEIETKQARSKCIKRERLDLNLPAEDIVSRTELYIESLPRGQPTQHHGSYLAPFPQTLQELHQGSPPMQVQPTRLFHEPQQQPNA